MGDPHGDLMIPATLDGVSAEWLTELFRTKHRGVTVEAIEQTGLRNSHTTKLQLALTLNDAGRAAGIPRHVCLKANWAGFDSQGICRLEARFYEAFRNRIAFPAPQVYLAGWRDDGSGQGLVVMEDLGKADGTFGISTDQMGVEAATNAVASLAKIHGAFWNSKDLAASYWLPQSMICPTDHAQFRFLYDYAALNHAKQNYQSFLPGWIRSNLNNLHPVFDAMVRWATTVERGPECLVHGDAHQGNSFLRASGERIWLDWQLVRRGRPMRDFSYFLLGALSIEERRANERDILKHYRLCLLETGAEDVPSDDDFWESYRRWPPYAMQAWLANQDEWGQPGAHIAERIFVAGEDLRTVEALGVVF